jgi:hypothetical protein
MIKHNAFTGEMYLTRRDTEALGLPIGNAFKGAPFKQKEMPFFIAPAIAAIGTAATLGAAIAATAVAIGTVAAVAGTAMTVVGAITGDKSLMKIGAIVGLAGAGVGMIAGGAAAAASGGSFMSGMGGLGSAGITSSQAAAASATAEAALAATGSITASQAGLAGIQGGTGLVANGTTAGLGASGVNAVTPAFQGISTGAVSGTTGAALAGGAGNAALQTGNALAMSSGALAPSVSSIIPAAANTGAASSGGFFSEMLSGMTPTEKLMTASFGLKAVGGIGDAYNANQKNKQDKAAQATMLANLNAQPTISGMFGYDSNGNKVTSPAATPTQSSTSLAPPSLSVPTLTPSGLLAQGVK